MLKFVYSKYSKSPCEDVGELFGEVFGGVS